jgi:hypothetical protein
MNSERYRAYARVRYALGEIRAHLLGESPCEVLRDVAEGFLLAESAEGADLKEMEWTAAATLTALVEGGRLSEVAADWLWGRLLACGPRAKAAFRPSFRDVSAPPMLTAQAVRAA